MSDSPINVTEPYLPPLEEFIPYLEEIWKSKWITNGGPFHQKLEDALCEYLEVPEVALFNNGTIALITALQALDITGEVITTPFSFVATSHALRWNNLTPKFVDIEPDTCNINPEKIEAAITPSTTAILGVHCYGNPCDIKAIKEIADKYNLKIIYDAAHAFGVKDDVGSILRHGDLSAVSFHATKVFNTFEGGAVICQNKEIKQKLVALRNFGIVDETSVVAAGINGKMSEANAALGLLQLKHIEGALQARKKIFNHYKKELMGISGIRLIEPPRNIFPNNAYLPIFVQEDFPTTRDQLYDFLKKNNINARRYFHPLISSTDAYKKFAKATSSLETASRASKQILCLPIYPHLTMSDVDKIIQLIYKAHSHSK
ncbi:MAG: DegT/DnrJ/EryC1/StrS family aminotransferase [Halomonadaceae bacterium]|jgi:dTDP-4-amino-4,6-dideoxygalactose transaminase